MVIEQYKTGFPRPSDVPFEDLSVVGLSTTAGPQRGEPIRWRTDTTKGTASGRQKKRTGIRALFNTARVIIYISYCPVSHHSVHAKTVMLKVCVIL